MPPVTPLVPSLDLPVVLLSHRGPVSFGRDPVSGERTASRGAGGLVTALSGLAGHLAGRRVGVRGGRRAPTARSPTRPGDAPLRLALDGDPRILGEGETTDREVAVRLVDVPAEVHEPFYGVVANPLLWFVQHRLHDLKTSPSIGREERAAFDDGYVEANRLAAEAVVEQVERAGGAGDRAAARLPLLPRRRPRPAALPGRRDHPLRAHPLAGAGGLAGAAARRPRAPARRAARLRRRRLPHRAPTPAPSCCARRSCSTCRSTWSAMTVQASAAARCTCAPTRSASTSPRSRSWPRPTPPTSTSPTSTPSSPAASSCCGSTAPTRARTSCAASPPSTCCSTEHPELQGKVQFLALLQPSRQDVPEYAAVPRRHRRGRRLGQRQARHRRLAARRPAPGLRHGARRRRPTGAATCWSSTRSPTA